jgi:diphthamide synthase (EF-2-diphthine--ammonia ligase)
MIHAISWSGGKDSTLALDRAVRQGLDVRYLFNIVYGPTGRVRFHGVRADLIARQAEALGLELIQPSPHLEGSSRRSSMVSMN